MYTAPIRDMRFALDLAGLERISALPGGAEVTPDLVEAVLSEAATVAAEALAPLNQTGDREGARLENGVVYTPKGFKEAYRTFVEGGWNSVPFDPAYGGQGLPMLLHIALSEMWSSANLSFSLCPLLTFGAVEAITHHGSDAQKKLYLPKLISGEWTGTMNLTEPQAGSDLSLIKTRAVREGEHYRITGQKIFITYGDHDFTDNIIHLVLARTPDAPPGTKGISLFIVPKVLVKPDGSLDGRNDLRCVSLEHKLGIHASPTAVMAYGDSGGAVGYLVGEENRGLQYMFTMMNNARLGVGLEGVAIAERAYQQARDYARTRVQSRDIAGDDPHPVTIIHHPDVRRMLLTMRVQAEASRALVYHAAGLLDIAKRHPEAAERDAAQQLVDLLIPVCKAWSTDLGVEAASLGIQVHGGMGFIEETGAAQHYRDARITPIYEGTNGIQANDLMGRKLGRDGGETARRFIGSMRETDGALAAAKGEALAALRAPLRQGLDTLAEATQWMVAMMDKDIRRAAAGAVEYLRLFGTVTGGWLMARAALAAVAQLAGGTGDEAFLKAKLVSARFYADSILARAPATLAPITRAGESVVSFAEEQF
ncbi:MAG TPA: acyl-CoA dehydrogenase C-terminal domain-containing protein [Alphaproteobacteria bacterium]|nr:acyl-CoA dehydrogenase C-terminal domain-containing protein [Alphaproteobacteria bacterium]